MDNSITILTPAQQQKRGERAFLRRASRDSHGMNWNAMGLADWLKGYDNAERAARIAANQRNQPFVER